MFYVIKHATVDLWIVERKGGLARWGRREDALMASRAVWLKELSSLEHLVLEPVSEDAQGSRRLLI